MSKNQVARPLASEFNNLNEFKLKLAEYVEFLEAEAQAYFKEGSPVSELEPYRTYIENWAARIGWQKDDGEGAFEFIQRKSYSTGWEDAHDPERGRLCVPDAYAENLLQRRAPLQRDRIKTLAIANGFRLTLRESGDYALDPRVFYFAEAIARETAMSRFDKPGQELKLTFEQILQNILPLEKEQASEILNSVVLAALSHGSCRFEEGHLSTANTERAKGRGEALELLLSVKPRELSSAGGNWDTALLLRLLAPNLATTSLLDLLHEEYDNFSAEIVGQHVSTPLSERWSKKIRNFSYFG